MATVETLWLPHRVLGKHSAITFKVGEQCRAELAGNECQLPLPLPPQPPVSPYMQPPREEQENLKTQWSEFPDLIKIINQFSANPL